jgi:hypothetical protein
MPETRLDRALFGAGLVAIALLALAIAHSWDRQHSVAAPPAPTTQARRVPTTPIQTRAAAETTASTPTTTDATSAAPISLTLTAARGSSWLQVRKGSPTGAILYAGLLTSGSAKSYRAPTLYVRFGQAGNIDASIDRHTRRLRVGTYTARFDSAGYTWVHS